MTPVTHLQEATTSSSSTLRPSNAILSTSIYYACYFFLIYFLVYMDILPIYMLVYYMYMYVNVCVPWVCVQYPRRLEKALEARVTDDCEPLCSFWELNRGPPEEQIELSTTEPSLWLVYLLFLTTNESGTTTIYKWLKERHQILFPHTLCT